MKYLYKSKSFLYFALLGIAITPIISFVYFKTRNKKPIYPMVTHQLLEKARDNENWKSAFYTGVHEQVVFMKVSPETSPENEIGSETHGFDQFILIVEGEGKAILDGKTSSIKSGDMVFIPEGTCHNIINLKTKQALKLISFYSNKDIPPFSNYKTKLDEE